MNSPRFHKEIITVHRVIVIIAVLVFQIISPGFKTLLCPYPVNRDLAYAEANENADRLKEKSIDKKDIAAEVNGINVTVQEVLKRYNLYSVISRYSQDRSENLKIESYLDIYIMELLILQEAAKMGIKVERDDVEKEKERYLTRNDLTEEKLSENLKKAGLTTEDAYRYFENNLILSRFGGKKFDIKGVSDEEAEEFYSNNYKYYNRPDKISVSHILICHRGSQGCRSQFTRQEAKGLAENIQKIATPENFSQLAERYSSDRAGAANGGDLGEITRGSAVPAFEKAAFSLDAGEISGVVETDFGFHIIYVKSKQKARSVKFEEARESIKNDLEKRRITLGLFRYSQQLLKDADIKRYAAIDEKLVKELESSSGNLTEKSTASSDSVFKTFRITDKNRCKNSKGKPIIMLFSTPNCPHCSWVAETFDETALEYMERGLIEAHHYDVVTGDDLLTPEIETGVPELYMKIYEEGSGGYVPYFNFGCLYHRVANGYERQDDLYAEEVEMRQVIDSLLFK